MYGLLSATINSLKEAIKCCALAEVAIRLSAAEKPSEKKN
jgi:hypothetical protein